MSGTATSKSRTLVLGAVLSILGLPVALALVDGASFHLANRNSGAMISSGEKREYLLYVPRSYRRDRPAPLVISLHGAGGWPAQQMELSGWNRLAEANEFIVVYPSGAAGGGPKIWHMEAGVGHAKDIRFIADLIDSLKAAYPIDATRIYANGLSAGGGMTFVLSCSLSDRIAAFGMVAAAQLMPWSRCGDDRPVPMIAFHGTADPITPYQGGQTWISAEPFPNIPTWTANWARRNRCEPRPIESVVAADVTRFDYSNCADDAAVVFYRVERGGHSWPGGKPLPEWFVGPTSNGVDATSRMWEFFREHPLRAASAEPSER